MLTIESIPKRVLLLVFAAFAISSVGSAQGEESARAGIKTGRIYQGFAGAIRSNRPLQAVPAQTPITYTHRFTRLKNDYFGRTTETAGTGRIRINIQGSEDKFRHRAEIFSHWCDGEGEKHFWEAIYAYVYIHELYHALGVPGAESNGENGEASIYYHMAVTMCDWANAIQNNSPGSNMPPNAQPGLPGTFWEPADPPPPGVGMSARSLHIWTVRDIELRPNEAGCKEGDR